MRHPTPDPPAEAGMRDGLAYTLWLPDGEPVGGVVVLHGADSCKENHHEFARAARAAGLAAVAFDQRGHGESGGALDHRALGDVATMAALLPPGPVALRGSSMGGWMALASAAGVGATAVVAICPASADGLLRGLRSESFSFEADRPALEGLVASRDLDTAVAGLDAPILFLHAEGDESVPVEHSRALAARARHPDSRLIVAPGGHHRSVQNDEELQGESLRFLARAFAAVD